MNPAFDIGRQVGNNFANTRREAADESSIDQILSEAMQSGDSKVFQNSIGKILSSVSPERQGLAVQYLQSRMQNLEKQQQQSKLDTQGRKAAQEAGYTFGAPAQVQSQQVKNQGAPKPLGGVTAQAIPPQFGQKISEIISKNPNATADELAVAFDQSAIPPIYTSKYIENRRRQDETRASNLREDKNISRKEELQFHKESEKYDEELLKQSRTSKKQAETIKDIDKAIDSGNVGPSSFANIFKGFGTIGNKISEALLNKDESTLLSSIPQLLEGWKEVFGVRLSDADLKLLQDKLPSIGKTKEANKSVLNILKKYSEMTLLRSQIANQIKSANKGLRKLGYADDIEKRFDEMTTPVKIINPTNGREIEIPAYKLSDALKSGAKLASQSQGSLQNE